MLEGATFPSPTLIHAVDRNGDASSIGMIGGRPYQLVAVPVKAPVTIAWITMGFLIDDRLAAEMSKLTSFDVSFLDGRADGQWTVLASSLHSLKRPTPVNAAGLDDENYASRLIKLQSSNEPTMVLLQRSLREALAPFQRLRTALWLITLYGVLMSVIGSVFTARSVTRPIAAFTRFSRRIGQGNYAEPLVVSHNDEIAELATSFNQMQEGIADREQRITEMNVPLVPSFRRVCELARGVHRHVIVG